MIPRELPFGGLLAQDDFLVKAATHDDKPIRELAPGQSNRCHRIRQLRTIKVRSNSNGIPGIVSLESILADSFCEPNQFRLRGQRSMTYCLGIITREGLVMASDSRSNAGFDQVNVCRKMYTFAVPGERVLIVLASGSLSLTQSVITLLLRDFEQGLGLAAAPSQYDACRVIGQQISRVAEIDRVALERADFSFNIHFLLGGQIRGESPGLYMIYPQGNPLSATQDSPFLQIGECKYGRPILDRGIRYQTTTLEEAAKYALISIDSTMRSNVTVGPPIDMILYRTDELTITRRRRLTSRDRQSFLHAVLLYTPVDDSEPIRPSYRLLRFRGTFAPFLRAPKVQSQWLACGSSHAFSLYRCEACPASFYALHSSRNSEPSGHISP